MEPEDAVRYCLLFHLVDTQIAVQIFHCITILLLRNIVFKQVTAAILILRTFLSDMNTHYLMIMMMMSLGFTVAKVNYLFGYTLLILMYSSVVNFCASIFDLHLL